MTDAQKLELVNKVQDLAQWCYSLGYVVGGRGALFKDGETYTVSEVHDKQRDAYKALTDYLKEL